MSGLPTIDEARAFSVGEGSLSRGDGTVPRRSPSSSSAAAVASAGARSVSPGWSSAASSPAPSSLSQASAPQRTVASGGGAIRRKREAFEYVSSDSEDEQERDDAKTQRNVQPRLSAAQQHARRNSSAPRSRSPSAPRVLPASANSTAASSAAPAHVAAAASSVATPAASSIAAPSPSPLPSSQHDPSLFGCRSVSAYRRLNTIDEGSYGVVHRAEERATGQQVALKKIKLDKEHMGAGFPITALREINILLSLRHPNIVGLREIVTAKAAKGTAGSSGMTDHSIYMVMEYCHHDLKALMLRMGASQEDKLPGATDKAATAAGGAAAAGGDPSSAPSSSVPAAFAPFRVPEIKNLLRQLLEGVAYLHRHWVLHRDLKTSNLLYSNEGGKLLICDFGLARRYGDPLGNYTPLVVTLWYRAPELLWGTKTYSSAVDMCTFEIKKNSRYRDARGRHKLTTLIGDRSRCTVCLLL
jgi:hypothetical protein